MLASNQVPVLMDDGVTAGNHGLATARFECLVCMEYLPTARLTSIHCQCDVCSDCMAEFVEELLSRQPGAAAKAWPFECPACSCELTQPDTRCVKRGQQARMLLYSLQCVAALDRVRGRGSYLVCPLGQCSHIGFLEATSRARRQCFVDCPGCQGVVCLGCGSGSDACSCGKRRNLLGAAARLLRGCPNCGAPSEKAGGCPRVRCGNCFTGWDWDAGIPLHEMQCDGEYRGQARTAWQWVRSVILLGIAVVCGWGAGNRWAVGDYIASVLLGELATFFTAETQSRGKKLFSSHAALTGGFCGLGLLAHYVTVSAAVPTVEATARWLTSWGLNWLGGFTGCSAWWLTMVAGEGFAVVLTGLTGVLAVAEWSSSVYGMLLRM